MLGAPGSPGPIWSLWDGKKMGAQAGFQPAPTPLSHGAPWWPRPKILDADPMALPRAAGLPRIPCPQSPSSQGKGQPPSPRHRCPLAASPCPGRALAPCSLSPCPVGRALPLAVLSTQPLVSVGVLSSAFGPGFGGFPPFLRPPLVISPLSTSLGLPIFQHPSCSSLSLIPFPFSFFPLFSLFPSLFPFSPFPFPSFLVLGTLNPFPSEMAVGDRSTRQRSPLGSGSPETLCPPMGNPQASHSVLSVLGRPCLVSLWPHHPRVRGQHRELAPAPTPGHSAPTHEATDVPSPLSATTPSSTSGLGSPLSKFPPLFPPEHHRSGRPTPPKPPRTHVGERRWPHVLGDPGHEGPTGSLAG